MIGGGELGTGGVKKKPLPVDFLRSLCKGVVASFSIKSCRGIEMLTTVVVTDQGSVFPPNR